jgi:ComF family protein
MGWRASRRAHRSSVPSVSSVRLHAPSHKTGPRRPGWPPWPSLCAVCHAWQADAVCQTCRLRFAAERPRCRRCALALPTEAPACGGCLSLPPPFEAAVAAVDYAFPWNGLIAQLKFRDDTTPAAALAALLAGAVHRAGAADRTPAPDLVVPVPLAASRLRQRGHNQSWELARRVARQQRLPARADVLIRLRDTRPQQDLPRQQRLQNLQGAFAATPAGRAVIAGRCIALVDDVMTTGATAREAARTLLHNGAAQVQVWILARTAADESGHKP